MLRAIRVSGPWLQPACSIPETKSTAVMSFLQSLRQIVLMRQSDARIVMATQDLSETPKLVERGERAGSIGMVLLVALALIGAAVAFLLIGRNDARPYILAFLSALAVIGVFSLFAGAAGILRLPGKDAGNAFASASAEGAPDAIAVTDPGGRVLYANEAYLALVNAPGAKDVRPVERVFVGDPDVSEAVYRLAKAAREGRRLQEEVRLAGPPPRWLRFRVRPLGATASAARSTVWSVADVTRDRERQENVFQELQHAIDYLDHAPAGFFSVDAAGDVSYLNATLANWLDHDLAQVGSGGLKLTDIVAGEGAALLTTLAAAPGEVKTEVLDLDLKTRGGRTLPARLLHKVAFAADGTPGASRTLVLNRARQEAGDPQRAAEVRFVRFFHNAPMAIATVDREGRIARANAPFARLHHSVGKGESLPAEGRSILAVVAERDRAGLAAAIGRAADGQGEIAPLDAALAGDANRSARFYVSAVEKDEHDGEAAIVYAVETTEQRALEAQFTQSQKMQAVGQLAGGIAHDFNNVLSAIMMATDFLLNAHRPTDPSFENVIVTLAVNARDAMPNGGKLEIKTRNLSEAECARLAYKPITPGDYVLIEVGDSGEGIPPEHIDKIFEPFFSIMEVGKATGLGLSTVYGIVKQTGGFIFPESEVGRGTTFRIFLPRHVPGT